MYAFAVLEQRYMIHHLLENVYSDIREIPNTFYDDTMIDDIGKAEFHLQ